jgi:hypothetical protein
LPPSCPPLTTLSSLFSTSLFTLLFHLSLRGLGPGLQPSELACVRHTGGRGDPEGHGGAEGEVK